MQIHSSVEAALSPILPEVMKIARRCGLPYDYQCGDRPRYLAGNLATPSEVRLVLVLAEPGSSPGREELGRDTSTWIQDVTCDGLGSGGFRLRYDELSSSLYEINPREFLAMVWPDATYHQRMRKTAITNSFWMHAHSSGGTIRSQATKEFGPLLKQLVNAFPNAIVVAAGKKARERSRQADIQAVEMGALTLPGCNQSAVRQSWRDAADKVRQWLAK